MEDCKMDKRELSCSLLNHYQNEWIHRHSHFWKILSSMYITNLLIICFPFCCSYFNITIENVKISLVSPYSEDEEKINLNTNNPESNYSQNII